MKYKNAKNLTTYSCLTNYAITFKGVLVVLTLSRKVEFHLIDIKQNIFSNKVIYI